MSEITINEIKKSTAEDLYNKVRALQNPYPNAYIKCKELYKKSSFNKKEYIYNINKVIKEVMNEKN